MVNVDGVGGAERVDRGTVSFLDQALWKRFSEASTTEVFVQSWLGLQCRLIDKAVGGVVVLGETEAGPYAPAAFWPDNAAATKALAEVAELTLAERRGIVKGSAVEDTVVSTDSRVCFAGYPFIVDDKLLGVVAIELESPTRADLRAVMRQLQWGAGWIEVMLRRDQGRSGEARVGRTSAAFDLVATALEQERFMSACVATVTELANKLDCDQVSIGFMRRRRVVVTALSHAAQFGRRMNLVRDLGAVMDEAVDQAAVVVYPQRDDWEYRVVRAHAELARSHGAGCVLTVPLHLGGRFCGALCFERPAVRPFSDEEIELCDCVASIVGPILEEKRRNDRLIWWKALESVRLQLVRLFGPRYFGRKLVTAAAVAAVAFFAVATGDYQVTAPASLAGTVQRTIVAPFDGYVAAEHVRAGEIVTEGSTLASLDDRDLALEMLRWSAKRREYLTGSDRARARGERAEAKIVQTQIAEADAQIELLDSQLERTQIRAPFDGIVISGDLSQMIGAAVKRGDTLFEIAPLDSYRVLLDVDERDIGDVSAGQSGHIIVSSMPEQALPYTIERITPVAEVKEGRNFYRVEAQLQGLDPRLRPGMTGVGKTYVEERLLISIWTRSLIDWARLTLWKWVP